MSIFEKYSDVLGDGKYVPQPEAQVVCSRVGEVLSQRQPGAQVIRLADFGVASDGEPSVPKGVGMMDAQGVVYEEPVCLCPETGVRDVRGDTGVALGAVLKIG